MFSPAHSPASGRLHPLASAYARVAVETNVNSASPHRLIALLFDGFVEAVQLARAALQTGQIEQKGAAIQRAARILEEGLKAGLNLEEGGSLADDLQALYGYTVVRLVYANLHNDDAALQECHRLIQPLREAWASIGPQVETARS